MSDILKLDGIDWKKLAKGAGIALAGALLTYISAWLTGQDFGTATPVIVAGFSLLANFVRKLFTTTEG